MIDVNLPGWLCTSHAPQLCAPVFCGMWRRKARSGRMQQQKPPVMQHTRQGTICVPGRQGGRLLVMMLQIDRYCQGPPASLCVRVTLQRIVLAVGCCRVAGDVLMVSCPVCLWRGSVARTAAVVAGMCGAALVWVVYSVSVVPCCLAGVMPQLWYGCQHSSGDLLILCWCHEVVV